MKNYYLIRIFLLGLLASLMLTDCVAQSVDSPIQTLESTSTGVVTTSSPAFTADDTLPVTTTESVETAACVPIVTPEMTESKDAPTTGSTFSEAPVTATSVTGNSTTRIPATEKPETHASNTPSTSAPTPETTTAPKPAVSSSKQITTTAQTPVPTPHTHSWSSWKVTKAATCTVAGTQTRSCSGCGKTENQNISATGHSWEEWIVTKATTTEAEGEETRICSKCRNTETRKIDKLPVKGATPEDCEWMAEYFLQLLNEERAKAGVQQLVTDAKMKEMAQVRADELTIFFSHYRPNMGPQVTFGTESYDTIFDDFQYGIYHDYSKYGVDSYYAPSCFGEDIGADLFGGMGKAKEITVTDVFEAFRFSSGHWNSLMNDDFGAVGIAVSAKKSEEYPGYYEFYFEVLLSDRLYD